MDGMLSASSQLQDSIVKFSNRGKWRENVTAQCPNLVHAAAPHKKVHLWCPTCHNGINSLPSVVILKPVLPIRDKTWEIFHISMSGGVLISQSFFVVWSQANAFFTISGQRWDFARLMYWLIYFQIFMFQNFAKRLDSKPILFRLILVPVSFFFGQRLVFQDFIFKQTHKKGRWILFSLFWIVFSSIITSVNPSFSSLWRKLFTPSRNNNKIYSRDTGRSHWESFHHLLRKLRLEFWETHFHICKFSLNIWIVDYLNICKFSLNRVPLGHTLDPC